MAAKFSKMTANIIKFSAIATLGQCKKLEADANFHQRYISIQDALRFRDLSNEQKETFVKDKGLTYEDQKFLSEKKKKSDTMS